MNTVLFVDDDDDLRRATAQSLSLSGFHVTAVASATAALREVEAGFDGVVVTDIRMPGMDGMDLLARLVAQAPDLPVILVSGHADVRTAVGALRQGACDVLEKPFPVEQLIASVERALERRQLLAENQRLRAAPIDADDGPLLGRSPAIEQLRRAIAQVAPIDVDVLIQGETGTGKGVVAEMLHARSRRRGQMVGVDCGALPPGLLDAELFGHVAGALPGNAMPRTGRIEQAHRGTLFLDDIDAMGEAVQLNVQRVLERREVTPLGASAARTLDLRVVAASHVDLEQLVGTGRFRASLFYRLNGVTLRLPPLRERREDVVPLFRTFLLRAATRLGVEPPALNSGVFRHLERHDWPGNVRELLRFAENVALGLPGTGPATAPAPACADLKQRVDLFEAEAIAEALAAAAGDATRACAALGLPRKTFYYKVQRLGIDLSRFRG
ncbi:sigma-54-dependent transcriptional regulator [Sphingomonas corticis]|jgi:two-component system C4-dicarboxylate transport response regulator DctD|uniref:Sigma-54-dependent Fis family transcriptional regulator n=1 Tax=Sphingomonas corticis TaxID=2722791 RepID=A0ABX1CW52_9SPHN|nr:sigma-54 dependent transcriptional regulator [Sphingomonas corticis]NJR80632.1 sigma-54-dependent Fis family transcriptional regulator [Sphingomonas corticis]